MSRGKRYNGDRKLNMKKVIGTAIIFIAIILCIIGISKILKVDKNTLASKNIELNYIPMFSNGNWGVINSSGETIIEPAYSEMIVIPNKSKAVFVCTYDVNYVDGTYKTKAVNDKNEEIFTGYQNIFTIQNYDENNNLVLNANALKVQKNGKYGLINFNGTEILPCEYDGITALKGIDNSLLIKKDGKIGLTNSNGTIIVPSEFNEVRAITNNYENGYIVQNSDGKFGVISSDGKMSLECIYEDIKSITDNNMYVVKSEGKWKVISSTDGNVYLEEKVEDAVGINNQNVIVNTNGKYGVLNIITELLIPIEYENLKFAFDNKYIAKKDGKYGLINTNNELLIEFKYTDIEYNKTTDYLKAKKEDNTYDYLTRDLVVKISAGEETILNGYISLDIQGETKYYNFKLEEKTNKDVFQDNTLYVSRKNGKCGFVNKDGKIIVDYIYDNALEQNEYGFSAIQKDGKWGAIDQYGNIVVQPTYELQNYEYINFIGKWHVCQDLNAGYYM